MDLWIFHLCLNILPGYFCSLKFEKHWFWLFSEHRIVKKKKKKNWYLYFPQYDHTSTQNLQYCSSHITIRSLEIGFRILFMTKKLGGGDSFHIWLNISGKSVISVLMINIYVISLRNRITGPLTNSGDSRMIWKLLLNTFFIPIKIIVPRTMLTKMKESIL